MMAKKRSGKMNAAVGTPVSNVCSKRVDGETQAAKIPNTTGHGPRPQKVAKIPGTVSCPGDY